MGLFTFVEVKEAACSASGLREHFSHDLHRKPLHNFRFVGVMLETDDDTPLLCYKLGKIRAQMNNQVEKPRNTTESGVFPKPDLSMFAPQESKEAKPVPAPKNDDPGSTSTNLPIITEGQDLAKDRDDSARGSKR
jgi:hypothetical protein